MRDRYTTGPRGPRRDLLAALAMTVVVSALATAASGITVPAGFQAINITPALTQPVAMAFAADGRLFVAEKAGVVKVVVNGEVVSTFIDLRDEVNAAEDRGMLGLALDPDFLVNRRVYMSFAVDPDLLQPDESAQIATFSRLVRYEGTEASGGNEADPLTRTVLIGAEPAMGIPQCWRSHSTGALRFAPDGSLLMAHGESAVFAGVDAGGQTPLCFQAPLFNPQQDIGAFRSQMLNSMGGKILRLDPETGNGLPGNPYFNPEIPGNARSRIWISGARNPFRFSVRPGTGGSGDPGTIYVGDVGWSDFEEINVVTTGGQNLGWPCYEGFGPTDDYPDVDLQQWDCATIGTTVNPGPLTSPVITFHHFNAMLSTPVGVTGVCVVGGAFHSGSTYPSPFRNGYFYADFVAGWIKVARMNDKNQVQGVFNFATGASGPVDFAIDPITGDLCYVALQIGRVVRLQSTIVPGDATRNGVVDIDDLLLVISAWGPCADIANCPADVNATGTVDIDDLLEVISSWS